MDTVTTFCLKCHIYPNLRRQTSLPSVQFLGQSMSNFVHKYKATPCSSNDEFWEILVFVQVISVLICDFRTCLLNDDIFAVKLLETVVNVKGRQIQWWAVVAYLRHCPYNKQKKTSRRNKAYTLTSLNVPGVCKMLMKATRGIIRIDDIARVHPIHSAQLG